MADRTSGIGNILEGYSLGAGLKNICRRTGITQHSPQHAHIKDFYLQKTQEVSSHVNNFLRPLNYGQKLIFLRAFDVPRGALVSEEISVEISESVYPFIGTIGTIHFGFHCNFSILYNPFHWSLVLGPGEMTTRKCLEYAIEKFMHHTETDRLPIHWDNISLVTINVLELEVFFPSMILESFSVFLFQKRDTHIYLTLPVITFY